MESSQFPEATIITSPKRKVADFHYDHEKGKIWPQQTGKEGGLAIIVN